MKTREDQKNLNSLKLRRGLAPEALLDEMERMGDLFHSLFGNVKISAELKGDKGDKGEDGKTPVKGRDYFTAAEIREFLRLATPRRGIDYFTEEDIDYFLGRATPVKGRDYYEGRDGVDGKDGKPGKSIRGPKGEAGDPGPVGEPGDIPDHQIEGTKIRFEKPSGEWGSWIDLAGARPQPMSRRGRRLGRGTGSPTQYYDLSSLCDGNTKAFSIPANSRILGVFSTQAPMTYRPTVDWTGSGTTTLTLTDAVTAPQTGQTLWILYVE